MIRIVIWNANRSCFRFQPNILLKDRIEFDIRHRQIAILKRVLIEQDFPSLLIGLLNNLDKNDHPSIGLQF